MENDLGKRIKRLEEDILAYKTTQPVGSDSVRVFTTNSNNFWDLEGTTVASWEGAPYGQIRAFVRWKSRTQVAPFGRLRWVALVNDQNYNYATTSNNFNSTTPYIFSAQDDFYASTEELNDPQILRWNIVASGPVGTNFKIKFFVDATDSGRLWWNGY